MTTSAFETSGPFMPNAFRDAHARVLPRALALAPDALVSLNVEVPHAVGLVLGKLVALAPLRDEMARLPRFSVQSLDRLDDCARALAYGHARYCALGAKLQLTRLRDEARALRKQLKSDATPLVEHGVLGPELLDNLGNTTGDRCLASDLLALFAGFHEAGAALAGKTLVTHAELERAASLANLLLLSVSERAQPRTERTAALADERTRLFTLFFRSYEQVRRAVAFLRFDEGDADAFAPSLYAGNNNKHVAKTAPAEGSVAPR